MGSDPPRSTPTIRAAGGVVWRQHERLEVALVHRPRYDDWSLPKGKLDEGETELAAAVREVGEELGSRVAVSRRLSQTRYTSAQQRKTVSYWVMRHLSGSFTASDEVDRVAWLPPARAAEQVSYAQDRAVLAEFGSRPLPDAVVVLVRHAKAGKRADWHGEDDQRPLESVGRRQARRLARFLTAFAPTQVVSADPVRCRQTVEPFARDHGLRVELDASLGDRAFRTSARTSTAALLALAKPSSVTVACSQGEAIPGMLARLLPQLPSTDTRKGAAWVLAFADGEPVGADYYGSAAR